MVFGKPVEAAKEKLAMLESGSNIDFGDYTSAFFNDSSLEGFRGKKILTLLLRIQIRS